MSLKFEGEVKELLEELFKRVKALEEAILLFHPKEPPDEINDWLLKRRKKKDIGRI